MDIDFAEELAGEKPTPTQLLRRNPLTAVLVNALSQSHANAAAMNQGEYKGGQTGTVIKVFLKDTAKGLPSAIRNAMIQMASENVSIPSGKHDITFAPTESGSGMEANLSNVLGGNLALNLDPKFLGMMFRKQF